MIFNYHNHRHIYSRFASVNNPIALTQLYDRMNGLVTWAFYFKGVP